MQAVFYRIEKKYLINEITFEIVKNKIEEHMKLDEHGVYTLCNIYYDTENNELIRKSLEKPIYKEKLRLRSYNTPDLDSSAFIEIKKKYNGVVNKRRIKLTLQEAYDYLYQNIKPFQETQILHELDYFKQHYNIHPTVYISYDRIAYQDKEDNNFRVTFDNNMHTRNNDLRLEHGTYGEKILEDGYYIMEVKTLGAIPLWFTHMLSELKVYPTSFSKYGRIYENNLLKGA